jgi:AcrR family transcriptional regulator
MIPDISQNLSSSLAQDSAHLQSDSTPPIDWSQYDRLKAEGRSQRTIAKALGVPRSTLRRRLAERTQAGSADIPDTGAPTALQRVEVIGEAVNLPDRASAPERIDHALQNHEARIGALESFIAVWQRQAHLTSGADAPERISASHPNAPQRTGPPVWVNRGTHLAQDMIDAINAYRHRHRLEVREVIDMALRQFFATHDMIGGDR